MMSRLIHPFPDELSEQLRDRLRRMLVRVDELRSLGAVSNAPNVWTPPVDIYEMEDTVLVSIEVPGLTLDQLRVFSEKENAPFELYLVRTLANRAAKKRVRHSSSLTKSRGPSRVHKAVWLRSTARSL